MTSSTIFRGVSFAPAQQCHPIHHCPPGVSICHLSVELCSPFNGWGVLRFAKISGRRITDCDASLPLVTLTWGVSYNESLRTWHRQHACTMYPPFGTFVPSSK